VTIQAQILGLLKSLQREFGMSLILITHDLGVVAEHADKVAVMYAGHIVENSAVDDLYNDPLHPYALGLLGSIARLDHERKERLSPIQGQPPSLIRVPPGCPFHPRCVYARKLCVEEYPQLAPRTDEPSHMAACHFAGDLPAPHPPGRIPA
jgi:oligopeptide/dipeptide ABC transporter ATP-binding protein